MSGEPRQPNDIVMVRQSSRLAGPALAPSLVERSRLDDRYTQAVGRVVRVVAPGGYGKSTIVARWAASDDRAVRWLDVEPIDNDPLVLAAMLELALAELADERPHSSDQQWTTVTAPKVIGRLLERARPFVLVIDDIHHIDDPDSNGLVELLARRLPADSTLVLIGRAHHGDSIARLRLQPGVVELSAVDLAFDLGETELMMQHLGLRPEIDDITNLFGHFEGWPAGLRLAALAREQARDSPGDEFLSGLERSSFVTQYVASEWLGSLRPADRELLGGAACLRRFTADMCDSVLGRSGSAAALSRLAHEEAMVIPLDQRDDWFRMHPVLSDSLCDELMSRDRAAWQSIHVGAAHWWADMGDADLAIDHAVTAGAVDLAESLIISQGPSYMARGMVATVRRWLDALGDQRLLESPDLCAFASVVAVQTGNGARALELVNLLPAFSAEPSGAVTNRIKNMRAMVAPCHPTESIELSANLSTLPVGAWRASARWARAVNFFLLGQAGSIDELRAALVEGDLAEVGLMHANVLATLSIIDEIEGRRDSARELARRAQDQVGQQRAETVATTAVASSATAVAMARRGDEPAARESLALARRHYGDIAPVATWLNVIGRLALVRACILLDDVAQGQEVLQELRLLRRGDDRIAIDDHLDDLTADVEEASTGRTVRRQNLTDAERRVLEHLPTNLSLSDIAVRLFVSRNTVKSHTAAIYRKLGVTSRTEAVEMARRTGLIEAK